jgi:hypothetical protein
LNTGDTEYIKNIFWFFLSNKMRIILLTIVCSASAILASSRVLVLLPLTGGAPEMGEAGLRGVKQAEAELRSEGLDSSLKIEDVQFSSKQAVSVVSKENFDGVISASSQVSVAIKPMLKVPQIAIYTQSDAFSSPNDLSYRMSGLITDEWRAVKEYFGSINNFCLLVGCLGGTLFFLSFEETCSV